MEKHRVKNGTPPPKNGTPPPPRSDPSNDGYIIALKKVTMDSVVDVYPPEIEILPLYLMELCVILYNML